MADATCSPAALGRWAEHLQEISIDDIRTWCDNTANGIDAILANSDQQDSPEMQAKLNQLKTQHNLFKTMLAAKAVMEAKQGKGYTPPSQSELRHQELQRVEAEQEALREKLVNFEQLMTKHRHHYLLTIDQHALWDGRYKKYQELKQRAQYLRRLLGIDQTPQPKQARTTTA
eukprot:m.232311 g.232311  ORF g.232311 m.232311 type:complete len:173 (+) comp17075_c4_seq1:317-835(+)